MNTPLPRLLAQLCDLGRHLHARNLLAAADGNLSLRLSDGRIAMTPTGVAKAALRPTDLAFLQLDGTILSGKPSSERHLHLEIYRRCPDAQAVGHAHPPTVIGWTLARPDLKELPGEGLPEGILAAGTIPIAPYARPGSPELAASILPFLPEHRLIILARHGALAWGEDLAEVHRGLERVEHLAQILKTATELGGLSPLPESEVAALLAMRAQLGPRLL